MTSEALPLPLGGAPASEGKGSRGKRRALGVASWIVGAAAIAAVIVASRHFSEERAFVAILQRAQPAWLLAAVALQLLTYAVQGQIWRTGARAGGADIGFGTAYKLSLAKLFLDQALPSGGLSGTVVLAHALEHRGIPRRVILGCVFVDGATWYAAYGATLTVALALAALGGHLHRSLLFVALGFIGFAAAVSAVMLGFAGRRAPAFVRKLARFAIVRRGLELVESVDGKLVRTPRLLLKAGAYHVGIVLLDASTVWLLILALGTVASPSAVFASFMTSTLLGTIGILPGGLGTFEATSVLTLKLSGIPIAVALSATLAFRVLSFWLPMIPGLYLSRAASRPIPPAALVSTTRC